MRSIDFAAAILNTAGPVLLVALLGSLPVQAHVVLLDPVPRTDDTDRTEEPCGGEPAGAPTATYVAGTEIEVTIDLSIQHTPFLQVFISYDNFTTRKELAAIQTYGSAIYEMTVPLPAQPLGPAVLQVVHQDYVSCADITLSEDAVFAINPGLNDAWHNPDTDGQGFFIIVYPDIPLMFLVWFTYDTQQPPDDLEAVLGDPGHRWLTASGPYQGNRAVLDVVVTSGGRFDTGDPVERSTEGTIEVIFEGCTRGVVKYNIPSIDQSGEVPIQRVANDNVRLCEHMGSQ